MTETKVPKPYKLQKQMGPGIYASHMLVFFSKCCFNRCIVLRITNTDVKIYRSLPGRTMKNHTKPQSV
jgi:hypothetical protein